MSSVKLEDIANQLGLSISTVSRALSGNGRIGKETRERVLAEVHKSDYTVNAVARSLRLKNARNIGIIVPDITNSFFAYLVDSIERTCRKYNYRTLITQTFGEKEREEEAMELVRMHHADGIILCAIENDWDKIRSYEQYGKVVVCNEYNEDTSISTVCGRQYEGFYKAAEYLIGKDYQRIAYCTGSRGVMHQPKGMDLDSDRYSGYIEALAAHGMTADPNLIFTKMKTVDDGRKLLQEILKIKNRPDAIIAGSDEVAAGILTEAMKHGINIPEDLAIVGVDDQSIASLLPIPLTTIRQPVQDEGMLAAKEIIRQLSEEPDDTIRKELELELVIRESA